MAFYKFLEEGGIAPHSGWQWPLPTKNEDGTWKPGEWTPAVNELVECEAGYHVTDMDNALGWANTEMYEVEAAPSSVFAKYDTKAAFSQCRLVRRIEKWNDRSARKFACDCADRVLYLFEDDYPDDKRPRTAIEVARRYAQGEATKVELAAAGDAAGDAARAAAGDAARAAACAVAGDVARDAACAAAWDAACAAAGAAARDAACAATWSAARDVARSAAWDATWSAARDVARSAAWDAERKWQTQHLCEMLGIVTE